ncbi:UDP-N-acetylglucosamine--N-acetylmuramyl-(pentapeptide) pyrophosphoryl-undecaprenol N-acetylglucosamine transferase, partial [bacterium]|nr:UDP-N-acetylglucosamine--N-acetylmuramyl-(pentapeptide) pyrophosphoryl-undecaprenol N-acetylglucosamine transferase [bacterium]
MRKIMLAGGGTAGHVYPALAVLEALERHEPGHGMVARWVGSERIEACIVPEYALSSSIPLDFRMIDIRFSYRRLSLGNLAYYLRHILPLLAGKPFRQALRELDEFEPDVVLATGGYVSAPLLWAAGRRGVPIALIEINHPPGKVNWQFAPEAWRVYAATKEIAAALAGRLGASKILLHGCPTRRPRRSREEVCRDYGIDPQRRIIVAMAGSLGAGALHRAVHELLAAAARSSDPRWSKLALLHVAGVQVATTLEQEAEPDPEESGVRSSESGVLEPRTLHLEPSPHSVAAIQYRPIGFLEDSPGALAASHYYIGRSGASTVGELVASGIHALLLPDPQHADRQQYGNAGVLLQQGQGTMLEQEDVSGEGILRWLEEVW